MAMTDEVKINGTTVTDYRVAWAAKKEWDIAVDTCTIHFSNSLADTLTPTVGDEITITRGFTTSTDEAVFTGQMTQVLPGATSYICTCKNPIYDAIKEGRTKSWDIDIDPEGGVGSEIFKDICDHSQIAYTSASVPTTGTGIANKIRKVVQNDEDDYDIMGRLAERYLRIITYDYDNAIINFKPKGFTTYPITLNVGTEISNQIKWKENMEQLINKVKIFGATVYDNKQQTFAGPATEFELTDTPEDTEARQTNETGALFVRGQKDVGTLGTDFDYYVDVEEKTLVFAATISNLWIRYGTQVPMPATLKNQASIDQYGGPKKIPHFKRFTFTDIKDLADSENRGRNILEKYSTPFVEAIKIPVEDFVIETYGNLIPGTLVTIADTFTNQNNTVFVKILEQNWPHVNDKITIGDEIWRTEDWQARMEKKVNQLFNELNKNQGLSIQIEDYDIDTTHENRYMECQVTNVIGDVGIYNHPTNGIYNTHEYGTVLPGPTTTDRVIPGSLLCREFLYDEDFKESSGFTATWNTGAKTITFVGSQTAISKSLYLNNTTTVSKATLTATVDSGEVNLTFYLSADGGSTWEEVENGVEFTFGTPGEDVKWKIESTDAAVISYLQVQSVEGT